MKKTFKILLIAVMILFFHNTKVQANEISLESLQNEIVNQNELTNSITGNSKDLLGDINISTETNLASETMSIFRRAEDYIKEMLSSSINTFIKIFVILVISAIATGFIASNELKSLDNYINMATSISICGIILFDIKNVLTLSANAINEIDTFSKVLMPTMVTAISFSGAPSVAVILQTSSMFVFNLVLELINTVLFPLTYLYIGIITVNSSVANDTLGKISDFIKWITTTSLKLILTSFITYMSITGIVSGSVDNFAIKGAKFATGFIPVVGGIISDASETVLIGANIVKNSIGVFGIIAIISICIIPFAGIIINYLMFKVGAVLLSPISTKQTIKLLDGISQTFNMALAMLSSSALVMFVMIIIGVMVVRQV